MRHFSKRILAVSLTTTLAVSAEIANASSSAQASIDWDSLTVQYFDMSSGNNHPVLSWSGQNGNSNSEAFTYDPNDQRAHYRQASNFTKSLFTDAITQYAQSSGLRSRQTLEVNAASDASETSETILSLPDNNNAYASVSNWGSFTMNGKGIALISLAWSISGVSDATNDFSDYASSGVNITGSFSNGWGAFGSSSSVFELDTYNGAYSQSGLFSLAIFSDGIHTTSGSLNAEVWARSNSSVTLGAPVSEVPLPPAVWMFGGGLLGMIGFFGRKASAA